MASACSSLSIASRNLPSFLRNAAKEEAESVITALKKARINADSERARTQAIQQARSTLDKSAKELNKGVKELNKNKDVLSKKVLKGDQVKLIDIGTTGTVISPPDDKGMMAIQAGMMKLSMHMSEIESVMAPKKEARTVTSKVFKTESKGKMEVDIRGMTVDEGIMEIDKYLDQVFLSGLKEVSIIHGKGTGKLRAGVHDYLKRHAHVDSYRVGLYGEGEMGVTVVTIK